MLRIHSSTILMAAMICISQLQAAPISRTTRQSSSATNTGSSDHVPQLLLDIYECWNSGSQDCLPIADPEVNVVRTLMGKAEADPPAVDGMDLNTVITFKTSSSKDDVHAAFLRVYRRALTTEKSDCADLQLELYSSEPGAEDNKDVVKLEERISIGNLEKDEWLSFNNIAQLLQNRTNDFLRLRLAIGGSCSALSPAQLGVSFEESPVIILYAKKEKEDELFSKFVEAVQRKRRQVSVETGSGSEDIPTIETRKPQILQEIQLAKCQLHDFNLSFADTEFSKFIKRPQTYNARICGGSCEFPITFDQHNPTRHAYILSLINIKHKNTVPPPCCAPDPNTLGRLPVVVMDSNENYSTQWWDDMIARSCRCL